MDQFRSTERFSDRVADYVRYRPDYPLALPRWLHDQHGVTSDWIVADIGAGTGISSRMWLDSRHQVTAVEPNEAMRSAALAWLGHEPGFTAVDGRADACGLAANSIDLISVAQAFHWFDPEASRREFSRILTGRGLVAIFWNFRRLEGSDFLRGYEALLLRYGNDYRSVAERHADEPRMRAWFGAGFRGGASFEHGQPLDFDALRGRLMSSSYAPKPGESRHLPMLAALRELFDACAVDGRISFDYDTRVYVGKV